MYSRVLVTGRSLIHVTIAEDGKVAATGTLLDVPSTVAEDPELRTMIEHLNSTAGTRLDKVRVVWSREQREKREEKREREYS